MRLLTFSIVYDIMPNKGGNQMGKILVLLLIFVIICAIWSLPLYLVANFVLWLFHSTLRITWLQAFGICLLATMIRKLLFKKESD